MATRFYLPSSGAAAVSPSNDAAWAAQVSSGYGSFKTQTSKISSALTNISHASASTTTNAIVHGQWVSDPLSAQTISGTVLLQMLCNETNTLNNAFLAICIRVVSNDGLTVRATLLSVATGTGATEFAQTTNTNRKVNPSLTSYTCVDGDRLCIEIGHSKTISSAGGHNNTVRTGDASGSDLPSDETTTTDNNPYVEFSGAVTFLTTVSSSETNGATTEAGSVVPTIQDAQTGSGVDTNSALASTFTAQTEANATAVDVNAAYNPTALPWPKYRPSYYGWLAGTGKVCTVMFGPADSITALFWAQDGGTDARYVDGYVPKLGNAIYGLRQSGGSAKPSLYIPGAMPKSLGVEQWPEGTNPWSNVGAAGANVDGKGGLMECGYNMANGGRQITVPSGYTHVIIEYERLTGNNTLVVKYDGSTVFTDSPTSGTEIRYADIALGSDHKVLDIQNTSLTSHMALFGVLFEDRTGANGSMRFVTGAAHGGWGADTWNNPVTTPVGVQSGDTSNYWADSMAHLDADLCVIFIGPNDARHASSGMPGVDASAAFATNLTGLVTTLDAHFATAGNKKPDLFFVAYPYIDLTLGDPSHAYSSTVWAAYVAAMQTVAASYGTRAQFLDLGTKFGPLTGTSPEISSTDNIHPNALGHSKIEAAMLPYLTQLPITTDTDTGAGADTNGKVALSAIESNATEVESTVIQVVQSDTQTASGTDANGTIALSITDTGSGADSNGSIKLTQADTATDAESSTAAVLVSDTHTSVGLDAVVGITLGAQGDTGSGTTGPEAIAQIASSTDSASGADSQAVLNLLGSLDTATTSSTASILDLTSSSETVLGTDGQAVLQYLPPTSDTGSGSGNESVTIVFIAAIKVWDGTAWQVKVMAVRQPGTWATIGEGKFKRWNGTTWINVYT